MSFDLDQLSRLANDPNLSTKAAFEQLGFNNYATFDYQLKKDPEASRIWREGRAAAAGEKTSQQPVATEVSAKQTTSKKTSKKSRPTSTPPAMAMPRMVPAKSCLRKFFLSLVISISMAKSANTLMSYASR